MLCFTLYLRAIFQVQAPGGLYLEVRFNRGFLALPVWGLIHGGAYFRNFTAQWLCLIYFNFCSLLVRYLVSLGKSLYGVYKNPQCNWECCFSIILSAQGGRENNGGVTNDDGDQDMETNQAQIDDVGVRIIYVSSL